MSSIEIRGLRKTFGPGVVAVDLVDVDITEGEFVVLLGPSGCGKTTILRCIAGLEEPDAGEIRIDGRLVFSKAQGVAIPPERRGLGMVFQSYAVWPHMTVAGNIGYPLRMRGVREPTRTVEVEGMLARVSLHGLGDRLATNLSGGQQQRVALARAVVGAPRAVLLDEPLSNLDAKLRDRMRLELRRLHAQAHFTAVHVTHDQVEAMALADRLVVMRDGRIEQDGSPVAIYNEPRTRFVAEFMGNSNFLPAFTLRIDGEELIVKTVLGEIATRGVRRRWVEGEETVLVVRASSLELRRRQAEASGAVGRISTSLFLGETTLYVVEVAGVSLQVQVAGEDRLRVGEEAEIRLRPSGHSWLLPKGTSA